MREIDLFKTRWVLEPISKEKGCKLAILLNSIGMGEFWEDEMNNPVTFVRGAGGGTFLRLSNKPTYGTFTLISYEEMMAAIKKISDEKNKSTTTALDT